MQNALKFILLVGLGALAALAFFLGAEPFERAAGNAPGERIGGASAVAVFFTVSQYRLARRDAAAGRPSWPSIAAMLSGLVVAGVIVLAIEGRAQWPLFVAPSLLAAIVGTAGGVTAGRRVGAARSGRTAGAKR